ncbi:UNVERIFIED_CONTAM: hypothetical protein FKN15_035397 [Acipenser sinensis]
MSSRILEEGLSDSDRKPLLDYPDTSLPDSDTKGDAVFERKKRRHVNEAAQGPKFSYEEAVEEAGMMIGGYVWGYLADQKGRQRVLVISLTVNGVFGALASLAPRFWLFLLLRFISGMGVGGSIPVIFSYFSEFQPHTKRGAMISGLATFWMAGNILAAGNALKQLHVTQPSLVIPNTFLSFQLGTLEFQSWRLFVVLCSIPSLSSALIFGLVMPESPKFLMEAGRAEEAVCVFRKMYNFNHRGNAKPFPWNSVLLQHMELAQQVGQGGLVQDTFSLLLSGVSVFFIWAVQTKTQTLIMSCVFSAVSIIAWNALDVIGTELYPTQLRSSALGFFMGVGRVASILGNVAFG